MAYNETNDMKYGFIFPGGDARTAADFAHEAEASEWDGFFVWEPVWGVDAWVTLAAAAMRTKKIRLGTMVTPVSRRRPWKLASETATLDHLSKGRLILSVGLGAIDTGFIQFGEETDRKIRAELLDEGLDIVTGLWQGQPFTYNGKHYHVKETNFAMPPPPLQKPRIPIWVVGAWGREKSMQRVLRYDGILPTMLNADGEHMKLKPGDVRALKTYVDDKRELATPFDIVIEGMTPGLNRRKASAMVKPFAEAGATWWMEADWALADRVWTTRAQDLILKRIKQGPPRK